MDGPIFGGCRASRRGKPGTLEALAKVVIVEDVVMLNDALAAELLNANEDPAFDTLDSTTCLELLAKLETSHVSLEVLTSTKVGRTVNRLAKRSKRWGESDATRRAAALVKVWRTRALAAVAVEKASAAKRRRAAKSSGKGGAFAAMMQRAKRQRRAS